MQVPSRQPVAGWLAWLVGTTILVVALGGVYWMIATYAIGRASECGNEVLQETTSAGGQYTATAFERGCGATAPFSRIVSVRSTAIRFDGGNKDEWVFVIQDQPDIQLTWTGPEHLTVKYGRGNEHVMRQAVIWSGISISYE